MFFHRPLQDRSPQHRPVQIDGVADRRAGDRLIAHWGPLSWMLACLMTLGCTTPASLHTWTPAGLASARGQRILLSSIDGNSAWASDLGDKMLSEQPVDSATQFHLVDGREYLKPDSEFQESQVVLASAVQSDPSDITTAQLASHLEASYQLRGTIIDIGLPKEETTANAEASALRSPINGRLAGSSLASATKLQPDEGNDDPLDGQPLRVSWRIVDSSTGQTIGGQPVVISLDEARERYPDLRLAEPKTALVTASAREAHRLFTPSILEQPVTLAVSRVNLGARRVRMGNAAAIAGDWLTASKHYEKSLKLNPFQSAALHNLALAKVASQEFSAAKELARKAVRVQPNDLHKRTLIWIEQQQRKYHAAFNLPDPPEGWHFTRE